MPAVNTTVDGVCYKTGGWSFFDADDDSIYTISPCDGSLIDGTFDQLILYGTRKYECAIEYVSKMQVKVILIFASSLDCIDHSDRL
jgi:hypothetical protein